MPALFEDETKEAISFPGLMRARRQWAKKTVWSSFESFPN